MRRVMPILLLLSLATGGCGAPKVNISEGTRQFSPSDYEPTLELWSRDTSVYTLDGMDNVLTATATYLSWEFRWAYAVRYSDDHRLSPEERAVFRQKQFDDYRKAHEFIVATTSGEHRWCVLGKESSVWKVSMINDRGDSVAPLVIEEIKKPTAAQMAYFPYINVFRQAYRITFPRTLPNSQVPIIGANNEYFKLCFVGALGNGELRWDI